MNVSTIDEMIIALQFIRNKYGRNCDIAVVKNKDHDIYPITEIGDIIDISVYHNKKDKSKFLICIGNLE